MGAYRPGEVREALSPPVMGSHLSVLEDLSAGLARGFVLPSRGADPRSSRMIAHARGQGPRPSSPILSCSLR